MYRDGADEVVVNPLFELGDRVVEDTFRASVSW